MLLKLRIGDLIADARGGATQAFQKLWEQLRERVEKLGQDLAPKADPVLSDSATVEGWTPQTILREVDALGTVIAAWRWIADLGALKFQRDATPVVVLPAVQQPPFSTVLESVQVDTGGHWKFWRKLLLDAPLATTVDLALQADGLTCWTLRRNGARGFVLVRHDATGAAVQATFLVDFATGRVTFNEPVSLTLQEFADDVAAAAGGIPVKGTYRTGSVQKVRVA